MKTNRLSSKLKFMTGAGIIAALSLAVNAQSSHQVAVLNNIFEPQALTIEAGDTVIWVNESGYHNVNGTQDAYPSNPEPFGNSAAMNWTYSYVFNMPGTYDYHCDPHLGLGMIGSVTVIQRVMITVNFAGMNPHVGQDLWLAVIDQESGNEVARQKKEITESFSVDIGNIIAGNSYLVDFYADHNGNGYYDAPADDHAWRIELDDLDKDTVIDFTHNINFTDIEWKHKLSVDFSSMNPHVGQDLYLAVIDKDTEMEINRVSTVIEPDFKVGIPGIEPGKSYTVNFFADFNSNGEYDAPPTDHAWQLTVDNVMGDTTLKFTHNTEFTDINWQHIIRINFSGMNPHDGQDLWLAVIDKDSGEEIGRTMRTVDSSFTIDIPGVETGHNYSIDFFSDHNGNGGYDAPPADHAWRLEVNDAGDFNELDFSHNTDFTDIEWQYKLMINFSGMDPHDGQDIWLAVIDKQSGLEIGRIYTMVEAEFSLGITGIEAGHSYAVDFFSDHNGNGLYDAPPDDHAWRLDLDGVEGDTTLSFAHNTDFTDIEWKYRLSVVFSGMTPHVGQLFALYLYNVTEESYADTLWIDPLEQADFTAVSYAIMPGESYNIDFFADLSQNGEYDAPPTDHAWRMMLENTRGDTTVKFSHNTDFTDIFDTGQPTGLNEYEESASLSSGSVYPNPSRGIIMLDGFKGSSLEIFSLTGKTVYSRKVAEDFDSFDTGLDPGMYVLRMYRDGNVLTTKLVVE